MVKKIINTKKAPAAIGTYSQAIMIDKFLYLSGQIPLDPITSDVVSGDITQQINQVFKNLNAICNEAGGNLQNIIKLNIFLTDLKNFALINEIMAQYFVEPYPARAAVGVCQLPKNVAVEMDAVAYF